jgi:hypothetical protein
VELATTGHLNLPERTQLGPGGISRTEVIAAIEDGLAESR